MSVVSANGTRRSDPGPATTTSSAKAGAAAIKDVALSAVLSAPLIRFFSTQVAVVVALVVFALDLFASLFSYRTVFPNSASSSGTPQPSLALYISWRFGFALYSGAVAYIFTVGMSLFLTICSWVLWRVCLSSIPILVEVAKTVSDAVKRTYLKPKTA